MIIPNNMQAVTRDEHRLMHSRAGLQGFNQSNPVIHKRKVNRLEDNEPSVKTFGDNTRAMYDNYMKTCQQINIGV